MSDQKLPTDSDQDSADDAAPDDVTDRKPKPGDPDYVGFRHAPRRYRFPKGKSGNPKGRPRGARGMKTIIRRELLAKVEVREGGRTTKMTKLEVLMKRLVEKGAKGDLRSISKAIDLGIAVLGLEDEDRREERLSDEDQAILDSIRSRLNGPPGGPAGQSGGTASGDGTAGLSSIHGDLE